MAPFENIQLMRRLVFGFAILGVALAVQAQTFTFSTVYSFKNNGKDPETPESYLTIDSAGNLYGTSYAGGTFGLGTVFKINKSGLLSVLHNFKGGPKDGARPAANVARDSAGNLYGTTSQGGTSSHCSGGCGTVFKLTPGRVETVLYNFTDGADGSEPSNVTLDSAKNIYGLSQSGVNGGLAGVVFELDRTKAFHVIYSFCALDQCADGQDPYGSIVRDSEGNIYGATAFGGASDSGTVFKVTPSGVETVLHDFTDFDDGADPSGGVIQDSSGNLYGTAQDSAFNFGKLFTLTESGNAFTTLYTFCSLPNCADGAGPVGRVQRDESGNLYGITFETAPTGSGGVVWEVNTADQETVLFRFARKVESRGGLTIDSSGDLYGCTINGGPAHVGSVFKLTRMK